MFRFLAAALLAVFVAFSTSAEAPVIAPIVKPLVIKLEGVVNAEMVSSVGMALAGRTPGQGLVVQINSPGGNVYQGLLLIRALRDAGGADRCEVQDVAASMAFVILESQACKTRFVEPASLVMAHGVQGGAEGDRPEIERGAQRMAIIERAIAEIVAPRIEMTVQEYLAATNGNELWVVGADAVKMHWADGISK